MSRINTRIFWRQRFDYNLSRIMFLVKVVVALACVVLTVQAAQVAPSNDDEIDVNAFCAGQNVNLAKQSQLDSLIAKLNNDNNPQCSSNTVEGLRALNMIVLKNRGDECSMTAFQRYRAFYMDHLYKYEKKRSALKLPKPLRDFAIAYGVQLSAQCRVNMVKVLLGVTSKGNHAADFEAVKELIDPDGPVAFTLANSRDKPDRFMLLSDVKRLIDENDGPKSKITLNSQTGPMIKKIQQRCQLRFKPIYAPLMLPIVRLANLGFEHRTQELDDIIKAASEHDETADVISKWSRVASVCDIYEQIELVQDKKDLEKSKNAETVQVFVIMKEDAAKSELVQGSNLLDGLDVTGNNIMQFDFEPTLRVDFPEVIFPSELKAFVNKFKTSKSELFNAQKRYKSIMSSILWYKFKNSKWGPTLRRMHKNFKKMMSKGDKTVDVSKVIVESTNELVHMNRNPDQSVRFVDPLSILMYIGMFFIGLAALIAFLWILAMMTPAEAFCLGASCA